MTRIDSQLLRVSLFKCPVFRSTRTGEISSALRQTLAALTFMKDAEKILSCINDGDGGVVILRRARNRRY